MQETLTKTPLVPLHVAGAWVDGVGTRPLHDKFTGAVIAEVAQADQAIVSKAVAGLHTAWESGPLPPAERGRLLNKAADIVVARRDQLLDTIVAESGFTYSDAEGEVTRAEQTLIASADEARRLAGDMVPLSGAPGQSDRIGFTMRVPLGVVCAITPFNSPLNTVMHKVAPALAAGNAVLIKPASATPMASQLIVEIMIEAGFPADFLGLVNGPGSTMGDWLAAEEKLRFFTFTGSTAVGAKIHTAAGLRRTQMELGSIAATILHKDANLPRAMAKVIPAGFRKAGQVCTSIQRLYVHEDILDTVLPEYIEAVKGLKFGNPHERDTLVGPMISESEAVRAKSWVDEAEAQGARILVGGTREGPLMAPTVLTDLTPGMKVMTDEIFGPVVCLRPYSDLSTVFDEINSTPYGLATGIYTDNVNTGFDAARNLHVGGVHINETCSSRVDLMPYGGVKDSGFGREGPHYAIQELTEERLVTISL